MLSNNLWMILSSFHVSRTKRFNICLYGSGDRRTQCSTKKEKDDGGRDGDGTQLVSSGVCVHFRRTEIRVSFRVLLPSPLSVVTVMNGDRCLGRPRDVIVGLFTGTQSKCRTVSRKERSGPESKQCKHESLGYCIKSKRKSFRTFLE